MPFEVVFGMDSIRKGVITLPTIKLLVTLEFRIILVSATEAFPGYSEPLPFGPSIATEGISLFGSESLTRIHCTYNVDVAPYPGGPKLAFCRIIPEVGSDSGDGLIVVYA
jgi:hypothetical protein